MYAFRFFVLLFSIVVLGAYSTLLIINGIPWIQVFIIAVSPVCIIWSVVSGKKPTSANKQSPK